VCPHFRLKYVSDVATARCSGVRNGHVLRRHGAEASWRLLVAVIAEEVDSRPVSAGAGVVWGSARRCPTFLDELSVPARSIWR
jgi:hypothetical protein